MTKKPTMSDIAVACGVSQATVSLVLNNAPGTRISSATRDAVMTKAAEIGYTTVHRRPDRRPVIAMIINDVTSSPHVAGLIDGVTESANERGLLVSIMPTGGDSDAEQAVLDHLAAMPIAGVIYARLITQQINIPPGLLNVPTVLLNCYTGDRSIPSVVPGDLVAGQTSALLLIKAGHRRVGYIGGEDTIEAARERIKGYRRALMMHDIALDPAIVFKGGWTIRGGYDAFKSIMMVPDPPTAICCFSDRTAMGVYAAAAELGLKIPEDISVVGFDNETYTADMVPPLTTMELPHSEMGRYAAEHLADLLASPRKTSRNFQVKIECELIERQSVKVLDRTGALPVA
ncbi:LacI family transcriptional regulator [Rhizobium sp. Leaf384]|uniref:LacI family DNA-binding transcriptional regulator n=1 Tax=unclassified Rhizobium TaxID=2613769 RepID=UPI0007136BA8|nr:MULTISPECIES: LacI family DNA-binding transcriptional regulator [unclassified Rhizobium]KQS75204.1 LacI family transcriptional regulator [Rhizobium sp. Leaf384]KQS85529.1 LacI family transcriptional regulator [Rhizobium sp. Leaf383]